MKNFKMKSKIKQNKEFVFTCTNRECSCLRKGSGLYFITNDIEEAEKHSRENNSPMWIAKSKDVDFKGIKKTIKLLKEVREQQRIIVLNIKRKYKIKPEELK